MKIVRGNDFRLKIEVSEPGGVAFDLSGATVEVYISSSSQARKKYEHTLEYNTVYVFVNCKSIWTGDYDVEVVIYKDGNLRLKNSGVFSIVDTTAEADVFPGAGVETLQISGVLNIVPVVVSNPGGEGGVFIPVVNGVTGMLSWTNNAGLPNPPPVKVKGEDGKNGTDGLPGKDGENGTDGKDGTDGINGEPGRNGTDGLPGKDGINGRDGVDGTDGINGEAGESAYQSALKGGFTGTETEFYQEVASIGNLNSILDIINGE